MKQILIVKTSAFGDIVHTYPVVSYLKSTFPDARIDWVVEAACADLARTHPCVSNVITIDTKRWRNSPFSAETFQAVRAFRTKLREAEYDVAFDLQGNVKSGLLLSQARAKSKVGFGRYSVAEWPNMLFTTHRYSVPKGKNIREDYLTLAGAFFDCPNPPYQGGAELIISDAQRLYLLKLLADPVLAGKRKVVVCPGSAWRNKQMDKPALISLLKKIHVKLNAGFYFAWGSHEEKALVDDLHKYFPSGSIVMDKMPLPLLQNLMNRSDLVVAMDSLPLHLAGTTSAATLSVFGPSSSEKYRPLGPRHFSYQGTCPYGRTFEKRCPVLRTCETGDCIRGLDGGAVFEAFNRWWSALEEAAPQPEQIVSR